MLNSKSLGLAALAMLSLTVVPAIAQPDFVPTDVNSPAAHKTTTIVSPTGRVIHTPPVGLRTNHGGDSGNS
jgi:hypothetical protein